MSDLFPVGWWAIVTTEDGETWEGWASEGEHGIVLTVEPSQIQIEIQESSITEISYYKHRPTP